MTLDLESMKLKIKTVLTVNHFFKYDKMRMYVYSWEWPLRNKKTSGGGGRITTCSLCIKLPTLSASIYHTPNNWAPNYLKMWSSTPETKTKQFHMTRETLELLDYQLTTQMWLRSQRASGQPHMFLPVHLHLWCRERLWGGVVCVGDHAARGHRKQTSGETPGGTGVRTEGFEGWRQGERGEGHGVQQPYLIRTWMEGRVELGVWEVVQRRNRPAGGGGGHVGLYLVA